MLAPGVERAPPSRFRAFFLRTFPGAGSNMSSSSWPWRCLCGNTLIPTPHPVTVVVRVASLRDGSTPAADCCENGERPSKDAHRLEGSAS